MNFGNGMRNWYWIYPNFFF